MQIRRSESVKFEYAKAGQLAGMLWSVASEYRFGLTKVCVSDAALKHSDSEE